MPGISGGAEECRGGNGCLTAGYQGDVWYGGDRLSGLLSAFAPECVCSSISEIFARLSISRHGGVLQSVIQLVGNARFPDW